MGACGHVRQWVVLLMPAEAGPVAELSGQCQSAATAGTRVGTDQGAMGGSMKITGDSDRDRLADWGRQVRDAVQSRRDRGSAASSGSGKTALHLRKEIGMWANTAELLKREVRPNGHAKSRKMVQAYVPKKIVGSCI